MSIIIEIYLIKSYSGLKLCSLELWIVQKDEGYWNMGAAIGEERSAHEMEGLLGQ